MTNRAKIDSARDEAEAFLQLSLGHSSSDEGSPASINVLEEGATGTTPPSARSAALLAHVMDAEREHRATYDQSHGYDAERRHAGPPLSMGNQQYGSDEGPSSPLSPMYAGVENAAQDRMTHAKVVETNPLLSSNQSSAVHSGRKTLYGNVSSMNGTRKPWSHQRDEPSNFRVVSGGKSSTLSSTMHGGYPSSSGASPFIAKFDDHDPSRWNVESQEDDDYLHDPKVSMPHTRFNAWRGCMNIGTLFVLGAFVLMLFMGYPVMTEFYFKREGRKGAFGLGGTNGSGQVPDLSSLRMRQSLIDIDTPAEVQTKQGFGRRNDEEWNLVFSDEFNVNGRSFYPGDDPYWEAVNLYAHGTGDYEWYDPAAVTTRDGALVITVIEEANHNLNFRSGQVTSWNQFCFTGGYLEAAVMLPGSSDVAGWWPAIWTMGNLGRANYGATTEGMWPYSYDTCDRGTLINQTDADGRGPQAAIQSGLQSGFNKIYKSTMVSWQPGQRLSACTCDGEDHPGPRKSNGDFKGRSAPEIDLFEAQVNSATGSMSLSCQFMPASTGYNWVNSTGTEYEFFTVNGEQAWQNPYKGSVLQMSTSGVAKTDVRAYQNAGARYEVWGVEYEPGPNGYITWWANGKKAWHMEASIVGPDADAGIGQRPIPGEPMYVIMNVALSAGFGAVEWDKLIFPSKMQVDYIRVYQASDKLNVGCDPKDFPTSDYIKAHWEAYTNPNLTIWGGDRASGGYGANWPRNRLYENGRGCSSAPRNYPGRLRPNGITQSPVDTVPVQYSGLTADALPKHAATVATAAAAAAAADTTDDDNS